LPIYNKEGRMSILERILFCAGGVLLLLVAVPARAANPADGPDPFHDSYRFESNTPSRASLVDSATLEARCQGVIQHVTSCPLDVLDAEQVAWCDYAWQPATRSPVAPTVALDVPEKVPDPTCNTPLGATVDASKLAGAGYFTKIELMVDGQAAPVTITAGQQTVVGHVKSATFTLPNRTFTVIAGAAPVVDDHVKSLVDTGGFGSALASLLRDRAMVELTAYTVKTLVDRVCTIPEQPKQIRIDKLLPATCDARSAWAKTGTVDLDVLRADATALVRHTGEEVLYATDGANDLAVDGGVSMAVGGRVIEAVVDGSPPTIALADWARTSAATYPTTQGSKRLAWDRQPISSGLYAASLALAVLPPVQVSVEPNGEVKAKFPAVIDNADMVALAWALADASAVPEGAPDVSWAKVGALQPAHLDALMKTLGGLLAGDANAARARGDTGVVARLGEVGQMAKGLDGLAAPKRKGEGPNLRDLSSTMAGVASGADLQGLLEILSVSAELAPLPDNILEPTRRVIGVASAALGARTTEEMRAALDAAVHPPGGYVAKRAKEAKPFQWNLVTGYVGAGGGMLATSGQTVASFVPVASVGPELGWHVEAGPLKSVFVQAILIDLGNFGAVPFTPEPPAAVTMRDAFAPGLGLHLGVGRTPIALSIPVQYIPGERPGVRVSAALTVDLVLFP
jgi:hypothetical protein